MGNATQKTKKGLIILKFWPLFVILTVVAIFSLPYWLKGLIPLPADHLVTSFAPWQYFYGMPVKNNAMPDIVSQMFPFKHLVINYWKQGIVPLWNPNNFSGNPLLANYQSAVFHPFNFLFFLLDEINAWSIMILVQPLLAGAFAFFFCRQIKISPAGSLLSAVAFMFCGFEVVWMGYGSLSFAFLFLPLILLAIDKCFDRVKIFFPVVALATAASFFCGHFQTSLYVFMVSFAYLLFKVIFTKKIYLGLLTLLFLFLGIGIASVQTFPTFELHSLSVRSISFGANEVIPFRYLVTLIAPDFYGNHVTRNSWYGNYAEWMGFIGVIPLAFAVLTVLSKPNKKTMFFVLVGLLALIMTLPTPLVSLLVTLRIPVFSTSAASRAISVFSFCFAILAGFGLDSFLAGIRKKDHKLFKKIFIIPLVVILIWIAIRIIKPFPIENIQIAQKNLILPTIMSFVIPSIFCLTLVNNKLKILKTNYLYFLIIGGILLFSVFDLFRFAHKWVPFASRQNVYPSLPVIEYLSANSGYDRVFGYFGMELQNYFQIQGFNGYDPLYIRRYGQLLMAVDDGKIKEPFTRGVGLGRNNQYTYRLMNLLGGKYLLHAIDDGKSSWTFNYWDYPGQFEKIYSDSKYEVYQNKAAIPRLFIANDIRVIVDQQEIVNLLLAEGTDINKTVVVEKDLGFSGEFDKLTYRLGDVSYSPNEIQLNYQSDADGVLVLTDNYYPGWKAYLDGNEKEIIRADFSFRGVEAPAGSHSVIFKYQPVSYKIGLIVTTISLSVVFLITVLFLKIKK